MTTVDDIFCAVQGFGPVKIRLGKVNYFEYRSEVSVAVSPDFPVKKTEEDYDVVFVEVYSEDLVRLHNLLASSFPHDYQESYRPFIPIAYVRAGLGEDYCGSVELLGEEVTLSNFVFSGRDGHQSIIPLTKPRSEILKALNGHTKGHWSQTEPRIPGGSEPGGEWTDGSGEGGGHAKPSSPKHPKKESDKPEEEHKPEPEVEEHPKESPKANDIGGGFSTISSGENRTNIIRDGQAVGYVNHRVSGKEGFIDDANLNDSARGNKLMEKVFPQIEADMKAQGVEKINAKVVDPAVGEKVWGPLGFEKISTSGKTEHYVKDLTKSPAAKEPEEEKPKEPKRKRTVQEERAATDLHAKLYPKAKAAAAAMAKDIIKNKAKARVDSEWAADEGLAEYMRQIESEEINRPESSSEETTLLNAYIRNSLRNMAKTAGAGKRNAGREVGSDPTNETNATDNLSAREERIPPMDQEETQQLIQAMREELSPMYVDVVTDLLNGEDKETVAKNHKTTERTVNRIIKRAADLAKELEIGVS